MKHQFVPADYQYWTDPGITDTTVVHVGAGVNDTCEERGLAPGSEACNAYLVQKNSTLTQIGIYVGTSTNPQSKAIYCPNNCKHDFVWERP